MGFHHDVGDFLTFRVLKPDLKIVLTRSVVRPAKEPRQRNRRVTFDQSTEKQLQKLDAGRVEEEAAAFKHLIPPVMHTNTEDPDDEPGIAKRTRSAQRDNQDIATRTRSKVNMIKGIKLVDTHKLAPLHKSVQSEKEYRKVMIFSTDQIDMDMQASRVNQAAANEITQGIGQLERDDYLEKVNNLKQNEMDAIRYLHALERSAMDEYPDSSSLGDNPDDWEVHRVEAHRLRGSMDRRRVEVKCSWKNGEPSSWVDMNGSSVTRSSSNCQVCQEGAHLRPETIQVPCKLLYRGGT